MRSCSADGLYGWVTDKFTRVRVPYGFASDNWADIGNASVYRHDNGADGYEIFNFFASQQEMFQIFDNYRRGRSTFTLSGATSRIMERYLAKMRDGAKGLAMQKNFLYMLGTDAGYSGDTLWQYAGTTWWPDTLVASTMVFDHFVRNAQRPAPVQHGLPTVPGYTDTLYPADGEPGLCAELFTGAATCGPAGTCPNGAYATATSASGFAQMSPGGKIVENQLSDHQGDYGSGFTTTAGSYYDKIYMSMLMTESVDNFISETRGDFIDKRYRSVSLADLLPDGYRRWMGSMLTNDEALKGAHIETNAAGVPATDAQGMWTAPIGWTKWWGDQPEACFPLEGTNICQAYDFASGDPVDLTAGAPANVRAIDSEFSWEVQKFLVTWTYIYLPENQKSWWRDQMRMYGTPTLTSDISLDDMIAFYNPDGQIYLAERFGKEDNFGKTVEKGISARVLQYANELLNKAYENTPIDYDGDGVTDWYEPTINGDGQYTIKFDDSIGEFTGSLAHSHPADCNATDNSGCTCTLNRACMELDDYISVIDWLAAWSGFANYDTEGGMIGIW
jgi:hypothetical protein